MPVTPLGPDAQLPRSHCFLSVAHGRSIRTLRIPIGVYRASIAAGALLLCWTMGATLYLMFHDDLVASLMDRQAKMQYAYEDRIAALRGQVEHESSVSLVGQSSLDARLRELTQRQKSLEARASLVAQARERMGVGQPFDRALGVTAQPIRQARVPAGGDSVDNPSDLEPTGSLASPGTTGPEATHPVSVQPKPRPEAANGEPLAARVAAGDDAPSIRLRIAAVAESLERIDAAQYDSIAKISDLARRKAEAIRTAMASAGLSAERFATKADTQPMGGPFVPLDPSLIGSPFGRALDGMQAAVGSAESLERALPHVPLAKPLAGAIEVTSPYGARLDPFMGRPAMHTGVDLREDYGTDVRATAAGRVVSAGPAGGYGTMIEIDHGHGLSTRYAHLSAVAVQEGQVVSRGEVIGEVGATGRATGPHLHYETRIDGEAVDPMRFLGAGERLAVLQAAL